MKRSSEEVRGRAKKRKKKTIVRKDNGDEYVKERENKGQTE